MLRARIEIALAALLAVATIATAIWPTWIEGLFGLEPDGEHGDDPPLRLPGAAVATIATAALARRDLRARSA